MPDKSDPDFWIQEAVSEVPEGRHPFRERVKRDLGNRGFEGNNPKNRIKMSAIEEEITHYEEKLDKAQSAKQRDSARKGLRQANLAKTLRERSREKHEKAEKHKERSRERSR